MKDRYVAFRVLPETKRKLRMFKAELGFRTMSETIQFLLMARKVDDNGNAERLGDC